ncbi:MAG: hypothetical protein AAFV88_13525 [Planctomycetota bacterium]
MNWKIAAPLGVIAVILLIGALQDPGEDPAPDVVPQDGQVAGQAMDEAAEMARLEAEIEAARSVELRKIAFDRIKEKLGEDRRVSGLVNGVKMDDETLVVQVTDAWHGRVYQIRLQDAQRIARSWVAVTGRDGVPRMRFEDLSGNRIGGANDLYGVWVDKD